MPNRRTLSTFVAFGALFLGVLVPPAADAATRRQCDPGFATIVNALRGQRVDGYLDGRLAFTSLAPGDEVASFPFWASRSADCRITARLRLFAAVHSPPATTPSPGPSVLNDTFVVGANENIDVVAMTGPPGVTQTVAYPSPKRVLSPGTAMFVVRHGANAGAIDVYIDGVRRATSLDNGAGVTTTVAAGAHRLRVTLAGTSTAVAPSRTLAVRAGSLTTAYVVSNPDGSSPAILRAAVQLGSGYHLVAADGGVFAFGSAGFFGSAANLPLAAPIATAASTGSQRGYWLAARDGGVFAFGDAPFVGSAASLALAAPIVAMAGTPTNRGYWLVTSDGGVFAFGDARFAGSLGTATPPAPIVAIAPTRTGQGYLLLAENGDVFAFGDARYRGGAKQVDTTAVALSAPASGTDYWVAFANGGRTELAATRAFLFPPLPPVNSPITSMVATSRSDGAWLASADGGVFALGTAGFYGAAIGFGVRAPIVAVV